MDNEKKIKTLLKALKTGIFDTKIGGWWNSDFYRCSALCKGDINTKIKYTIVGHFGKDIIFDNDILKFSSNSIKYEIIDYSNICKESGIKLAIPDHLDAWGKKKLFEPVQYKFNQFNVSVLLQHKNKLSLNDLAESQ